MARKPFFSGNYGSALSSNANAANLIARAGATQGQMFANLGDQIGGMIQQYGLNKEKRNKLQATLEGQLSADPSIVQQLTMSGDEASDKKNMKLFEDIESGDASIAQLERANGLLAGKTTQENAMLKRRVEELNISVQEGLKDPTIKKAIAEANTAQAESNYADSITSEKYAGMVQNNNLKAAQAKHQELLTKALENKEQYTPGQVVDIEGPSGEKVRFYFSGETLQPLNDGKYIKDINKAIIQGVDPAELEAYIDRTYDVVDGQLEYKDSTKYGFGDAPKKNPLMEKAISILALYEVNNKDSAVSNQPTPTTEVPVSTQQEFDALPRGTIYIGKDGKRRKKP
jgi:hypothetical protein